MDIVNRFIKYVMIETTSDRNSTTVPSSDGQLILAKLLKDELLALGVEDAYVSEYGVVYGHLKANIENAPKIGLIAHMDTSEDMSGKNIHPGLVKNYHGGIITLNKELNIKLDPKEFPCLLKDVGSDLIVTDGTTLLGGDDKAGIACIMDMLQTLHQNKDIKHGQISIAFTPDEEIGKGTDHFDIEAFDADYAYTVDGGDANEIEYENFNAAKAHIEIVGSSIHPGDAKDKMVNAGLLAVEFASRFPKEQIPSKTEGREGFYHLTNLQGDVELATLDYILREHDEDKFKAQKNFVTDLVDEFNQKYDGRFQLEIKDQYKNMYSYIKHDMRCVDKAKQAIEMAGIKPVSNPVRGGTDGAMLSEKGLLTPNLGTGSFNHHGRYEFASIQKMEKMVDIVINIIKY